MKNLIKKILRYREFDCAVYSGQGYIQGIGFSVMVRKVSILGFEFVKNVSVDVDLEWFETLKHKLNRPPDTRK